MEKKAKKITVTSVDCVHASKSVYCDFFLFYLKIIEQSKQSINKIKGIVKSEVKIFFFFFFQHSNRLFLFRVTRNYFCTQIFIKFSLFSCWQTFTHHSLYTYRTKSRQKKNQCGVSNLFVYISHRLFFRNKLNSRLP